MALCAQKPNARRVGIRIPEDTEDVDLPQVRDGHRQRLDRRPHADHDDLPARARSVEARMHADLLARALERHIHALVLVVPTALEGGRGVRQG